MVLSAPEGTDVDFDLYFGATLVYSQSSPGREELFGQPLPSGRYTMRVYSDPASRPALYDLYLSPQCALPICTGDRDGTELPNGPDNDTATAASMIGHVGGYGLLPAIDGQLCAADVDYFEFQADGGCQIDAFVRAPGIPDIELQLSWDGGPTVDGTVGDDGRWSASVLFDQPFGAVRARVRSRSNLSGSYALQLAATCGLAPVCPDNDAFEPNDNQGAAQRIESWNLQEGVLCGAEQDWYRIQTPPNATLAVFLNARAPATRLKASIHTTADGVVRSADVASNLLTFHVPTGAGGTTYIQLPPQASGQPSTYRYTLQAFIIDPPALSCATNPVDLHEANNTVSTATRLSLNVPHEAIVCGSDVDTYALTTERSCAKFVSASWASGSPPLALELLDAQGASLGIPPGLSGSTLTVGAPLPAGTSYARITPANGGGTYTLTFTTDCSGAGFCGDGTCQTPPEIDRTCLSDCGAGVCTYDAVSNSGLDGVMVAAGNSQYQSPSGFCADSSSSPDHIFSVDIDIPVAELRVDTADSSQFMEPHIYLEDTVCGAATTSYPCAVTSGDGEAHLLATDLAAGDYEVVVSNALGVAGTSSLYTTGVIANGSRCDTAFPDRITCGPGASCQDVGNGQLQCVAHGQNVCNGIPPFAATGVEMGDTSQTGTASSRNACGPLRAFSGPEQGWFVDLSAAPQVAWLEFDSFGSSFDTALSWVQGLCTGTAATCNDDAFADFQAPQSHIVINNPLAQTGYLILDGKANQAGPFQVHGRGAWATDACDPNLAFIQCSGNRACSAAGTCGLVQATACVDLAVPLDGMGVVSGSTVNGLANAFNFCDDPDLIASSDGPERIYGLNLLYPAAWLDIDTAGSQYDTAVHLVDGSCSNPAVACDNGSVDPFELTGHLRVNGVMPGDWYIAVDGNSLVGPNQGNYTVAVTGEWTANGGCDPAFAFMQCPGGGWCNGQFCEGGMSDGFCDANATPITQQLMNSGVVANGLSNVPDCFGAPTPGAERSFRLDLDPVPDWVTFRVNAGPMDAALHVYDGDMCALAGCDLDTGGGNVPEYTLWLYGGGPFTHFVVVDGEDTLGGTVQLDTSGEWAAQGACDPNVSFIQCPGGDVCNPDGNGGGTCGPAGGGLCPPTVTLPPSGLLSSLTTGSSLVATSCSMTPLPGHDQRIRLPWFDWAVLPESLTITVTNADFPPSITLLSDFEAMGCFSVGNCTGARDQGSAQLQTTLGTPDLYSALIVVVDSTTAAASGGFDLQVQGTWPGNGLCDTQHAFVTCPSGQECRDDFMALGQRCQPPLEELPNDCALPHVQLPGSGLYRGNVAALQNNVQLACAAAGTGPALGPDLTFQIDLPVDAERLYATTAGSEVDTQLFLMADGCTLAELVACNDSADPSGGEPSSILDVTGLSAGRYFITVETPNSLPEPGAIELRVDLRLPGGGDCLPGSDPRLPSYMACPNETLCDLSNVCSAPPSGDCSFPYQIGQNGQGVGTGNNGLLLGDTTGGAMPQVNYCGGALGGDVHLTQFVDPQVADPLIDVRVESSDFSPVVAVVLDQGNRCPAGADVCSDTGAWAETADLTVSPSAVQSTMNVIVDTPDAVSGAYALSLSADLTEGENCLLDQPWLKCPLGTECVWTGFRAQCLQPDAGCDDPYTLPIIPVLATPIPGFIDVPLRDQGDRFSGTCGNVTTSGREVRFELTLTEPLARLDISTEGSVATNGTTPLDTAVFFLRDTCRVDEHEPGECNDDVALNIKHSALSVFNLAAGTYYIVVDTVNDPGGLTDTIRLALSGEWPNNGFCGRMGDYPWVRCEAGQKCMFGSCVNDPAPAGTCLTPLGSGTTDSALTDGTPWTGMLPASGSLTFRVESLHPSQLLLISTLGSEANTLLRVSTMDDPCANDHLAGNLGSSTTFGGSDDGRVEISNSTHGTLLIEVVNEGVMARHFRLDVDSRAGVGQDCQPNALSWCTPGTQCDASNTGLCFTPATIAACSGYSPLTARTTDLMPSGNNLPDSNACFAFLANGADTGVRLPTPGGISRLIATAQDMTTFAAYDISMFDGIACDHLAACGQVQTDGMNPDFTELVVPSAMNPAPLTQGAYILGVQADSASPGVRLNVTGLLPEGSACDVVANGPNSPVICPAGASCEDFGGPSAECYNPFSVNTCASGFNAMGMFSWTSVQSDWQGFAVTAAQTTGSTLLYTDDRHGACGGQFAPDAYIPFTVPFGRTIPTLVVRTAAPTAFNAIVSVLDGSCSEVKGPLDRPCAEIAASESATLLLHDVQPGDYVVAIDGQSAHDFGDWTLELIGLGDRGDSCNESWAGNPDGWAYNCEFGTICRSHSGMASDLFCLYPQ